MKPATLGAWRLRHAKLTQAEAADRAGIPLQHASAIESNPNRATVGALASYVQACGGKLECLVEVGGVRRLLVLLAMLVGCGGAVADPADPPAGFCDTYRCELEVTTFAPSPELAAATEVVLRRLRKVTGRNDLRIDTAGVPIEYAEDLRGAETDAQGEHPVSCGLTTVAIWDGGAPSPLRFTQRIQLDPTPPLGCPRGYVNLMHELIHALAPHAEHVQEPSLFAASIYRAHSFDAPASAALCREFACETFAPEPSEGP